MSPRPQLNRRRPDWRRCLPSRKSARAQLQENLRVFRARRAVVGHDDGEKLVVPAAPPEGLQVSMPARGLIAAPVGAAVSV